MKWLVLFFILPCTLQAAEKFEVQGHRGARWVHPENTIPAFLYALSIGVDTLEMDMHVTKDNVIVITHDPYLNSELCLDRSGKKLDKKFLVRSLTLKELQEFDCGSLRNPKFPEQTPVPKTKIPTLEQVFEAVTKSERPNSRIIQFNIETKSEEAHPEFTPPPEEFVKMFLGVVKKHKLMDRVMLQSFDYRTLKIAHQLEPNLRLSVLIEDRPKEADGLSRLIRETNAQILSPNFEWLTEKDVAEMHKMKVRVIPWTPNSPADWKHLKSIGVDGIITDNPRGLLP